MACDDLSAADPSALLEPACLKYVVSKALGYAIVTGSVAVKLPQVYSIIKAGNVDGLSPTSILLEMVSLTSSLAYYAALGYPFSTWGENFFLFAQHAAITTCYFHYTSGLLSSRAMATVLPLIALGLVLFKRMVPEVAMPEAACEAFGKPAGCTLTCESLAGGLPVVLGLFARLPQIAQNMRQGHTGQLSLITYMLNVAGSGARAFTIVQELNDKLALTSALSAFAQNAVLVAQILLLGSAKGGGAGKGGGGAAAPAMRSKRATKKID